MFVLAEVNKDGLVEFRNFEENSSIKKEDRSFLDVENEELSVVGTRFHNLHSLSMVSAVL